MEEAGKSKQQVLATKKSTIKVVLGTLTAVLEFKRKLHIHMSSFPIFGKLSSVNRKVGPELKAGIKQLRNNLLSTSCSQQG